MDIIKRSILMQLIAPLLTVLMLGLGGLGLFIPKIVEENAIENAVDIAKTNVQIFKDIRQYYTNNIVKKVLQVEGIKPVIKHAEQQGTIPLPATFIHDLSAAIKDSIVLGLYSQFPFPNRDSRQLDEFELASWNALKDKGSDDFIRVEEQHGRHIVRVGVPDVMTEQACVNCHNSRADTPKNDWKLGDVRGVLSIAVDIQDEIDKGQVLAFKIIALVALFGLLISLLMIINVKGLTLRLDKIGDSINSAASGNLNTRVNAEGLDEITHLSTQYNALMDSTHALVANIITSSEKVLSEADSLNQATDVSSSVLATQQQDIEKVASGVLQMKTAISDVTGNIHKTNEVILSVGADAEQGEDILNNTISSIATLEAEIKGAVSVIEQLNNDSTQMERF